MKDERSLPTGRLGRLGRLVSAGARAGIDLLGKRDSTHSAAAAAEVLGTLRGSGQSRADGKLRRRVVVPEQHRAAL
ncbi:MAG: hypothetical protein U0787_18645 [Polyangia bacterium]